RDKLVTGVQTCALPISLATAGSSRTFRRARGRRLLVAGQTAAALVLAVTAALLGRSLQHLVSIRHGFDADRLVAVDLYLRGGVKIGRASCRERGESGGG